VGGAREEDGSVVAFNEVCEQVEHRFVVCSFDLLQRIDRSFDVGSNIGGVLAAKD
jgi:hypothetical protein